MSLTLNKESEFFDLQFAKQVKIVTQDGQLILAYDGVLNNETISKLETEIESKILEKSFPKPVVKKVFFICVESLQNQLIHGHKDDKGSQHNFFMLANSLAFPSFTPSTTSYSRMFFGVPVSTT